MRALLHVAILGEPSLPWRAGLRAEASRLPHETGKCALHGWAEDAQLRAHGAPGSGTDDWPRQRLRQLRAVRSLLLARPPHVPVHYSPIVIAESAWPVPDRMIPTTTSTSATVSSATTTLNAAIGTRMRRNVQRRSNARQIAPVWRASRLSPIEALRYE